MKQDVAFDTEGMDDDALSLLGLPPRPAKSPPGQPPRKVGRPASVNLPRGTGANPELLAEKIALTLAQREKLEIANARARRELVSAATVEAEWADILRDLRAAMLALPARLQQRLPHLTAHDIAVVDREVRDLLTEMAAAPAAASVEAQTDPEGTHDRD